MRVFSIYQQDICGVSGVCIMGRYSKVGPLILLQPFPARFALYTTRIPRSPVAMHSLNISILGIWRVCPFSSFFSGSLVFCFSVRFYWASQHHGWVFLLLSVWQICVCCLMYDIDLCRLPGDDEVSRVVMVVGHNLHVAVEVLWTFGWMSLFVKLLISFFPLFLGLVSYVSCSLKWCQMWSL